MAKTDLGFVAMKSLRQGASDPAAALAEIRRIYFRTTRRTIENDLAHAVELLKSLQSEEERKGLRLHGGPQRDATGVEERYNQDTRNTSEVEVVGLGRPL